jgi:hypothetical protein
MEVPFLSVSSILSLNDHVSIVEDVEVSSATHGRDDVEISLNKDANSFVQLTLLWLGVLINIDDFPLLSEVLTTLVVDLDVSVFHVSVKVLVLNFKNLALLVDNVSTFSSEDLPPS